MSEPLRGSGSEDVGGLSKGTSKDWSQRVRGREEYRGKRCWDTSHYNINQPRAQGFGCPCTGGQKAQEEDDGKEERGGNEEKCGEIK